MADNIALYTGTGRRKEATARVRLIPGTGKVSVNAMAPFRVTDTVGRFDVFANCDGGGINGQSGALRLGIARALLEAGEYRAELKKAGLLTRDSRPPERKKYGLKKAPQFSKR